MGQQAVFRTDKQLSRRQAQLRGAEVDRGGGSVWGVWCVPVVCWGGEAPLPHPCLFPFPLPDLPAACGGEMQPSEEEVGGTRKEVRRRRGAKGAGPGEAERVRKQMPPHTSTRVCTAHVPNIELAQGSSLAAGSQAPQL